MAAPEFCRATLGLSYEVTLAYAITAVIVCGMWLYAVGQRVPPGPRRLAAAAGAIIVNVFVPKLFCRWEDSTTIVLMSFNVMWLASFKALSWAIGRGALCIQPYTPSQFAATYLFPITPVLTSTAGKPAAGPAAEVTLADSSSKVAAPISNLGPGANADDQPIATDGSTSQPAEQGGAPTSMQAVATAAHEAKLGGKGRLGEDAGSSATMVSAWLGKMAFIAFVVWLLQYPLPGIIESFFCGMALYALLSLIMDGPAALVIGLTGLRVSPHFDKPWLSTTVASFWSKRWDLAAGNTLRQLIFESVVEGSILAPPHGKPRKRPSPLRQFLGSLACFAASGLIHECIFWYLTGHTTRGVWLSFFVIQAPIIVAERIVLSALKRRHIMLHDWLRALITMTVVCGTAQYLFFGPCQKYGVTDSVLGNVRQSITAVVQGVGALSKLAA